MSLFVVIRVLVDFHFTEGFNRNSMKPTEYILIRHCAMWRLIWVCTLLFNIFHLINSQNIQNTYVVNTLRIRAKTIEYEEKNENITILVFFSSSFSELKRSFFFVWPCAITGKCWLVD